MRRVGTILLLLIGGMVSLPTGQVLAKYHSCLLVYMDHAAEWCVAPTRVAMAQQYMSVAPINPAGAVFAATGLSPIQVIFTTERAYSTRHVRQGTTSITYLFGAVPAAHGYLRMVHTSTGSTDVQFPKFVLVQEIAGRYVPASQSEHRITCPPGVVGTSGLLDGIGGCGLQIFTQYVQARHLSIVVTGNVTAQQVRRIGAAIAASGPGQQVMSAPIGLDHVPGWTVARIDTLRVESNWQAWRDSRVSGRYFYHGSWKTLGRLGGWFEVFQLDQGVARARTAVLVSQFESMAAAAQAYKAVLPHTSQLTPLAVGTQAAEWQTNAGVASGPQGLAGYFGGFTTYLLSGHRVVEIHAEVGGAPCSVLRPPLPNPGRAIARRLAYAVIADSKKAAMGSTIQASEE